MACGICATAGWQPSNWVAGRDELQLEHSAQSIQLPIRVNIYWPGRGRKRDKANTKLLQWQVESAVTWRNEFRPWTRVNNPINAKFPNHIHTSSYDCICSPLLLFWGFARCFFFFSTGTTLHPQQLHTGSTVAMAISMAEKERECKNK